MVKILTAAKKQKTASITIIEETDAVTKFHCSYGFGATANSIKMETDNKQTGGRFAWHFTSTWDARSQEEADPTGMSISGSTWCPCGEGWKSWAPC
jgi:hypothetical protein